MTMGQANSLDEIKRVLRARGVKHKWISSGPGAGVMTFAITPFTRAEHARGLSLQKAAAGAHALDTLGYNTRVEASTTADGQYFTALRVWAGRPRENPVKLWVAVAMTNAGHSYNSMPLPSRKAAMTWAQEEGARSNVEWASVGPSANMRTQEIVVDKRPHAGKTHAVTSRRNPQGSRCANPRIGRNSGSEPFESNAEWEDWQRRDHRRKESLAHTAAGKLAVKYDGDPDETGHLSIGWGPSPHNQRMRYGRAYFDPACLPEHFWYLAPTQEGAEAIAAYILANHIQPTRANPRRRR